MITWRSPSAPKVRSDAPILVLGNGPSLTQPESLAAWKSFPGWVIGCNVAWKIAQMHGVEEPPALVCFDRQQAEAALEGSSATWVLVPDHPQEVFRLRSSHCDDRVVWASPYDHVWPDSRRILDWDPASSPAVTHLSGFLAFQWAMVMGARRIFLLGMDVGGIEAGGEIALSAARPDWPGYAFNRIDPRFCRDVGWARQPLGWLPTWDRWKSFTDRAGKLGHKVYRLADTGALVWLDVVDPCQRPPTD